MSALGALAAGAFTRLTFSVWGPEIAFAPLGVLAAIAVGSRVSGTPLVPLLLFIVGFVALLPLGGPQGPASGQGGGPIRP